MEQFLCLSRLNWFDAEAIKNSLEQDLQSHGIADLKVVAQSYDGAAVMSGSVWGVQARFQEIHPEAIYVHCYAHELNLVLYYTCKAIPEASCSFDTLESLREWTIANIVHPAVNNFPAVIKSLQMINKWVYSQNDQKCPRCTYSLSWKGFWVK